jgi:hypothetical protein
MRLLLMLLSCHCPASAGLFLVGSLKAPAKISHSIVFSFHLLLRARCPISLRPSRTPRDASPGCRRPRIVAGALYLAASMGGHFMRQYRIYTVGTHGQFSGVQVIKCAHDQEAFQKAQQLAAGQDVELWEGARCIGRLSHEDQQTAD